MSLNAELSVTELLSLQLFSLPSLSLIAEELFGSSLLVSESLASLPFNLSMIDSEILVSESSVSVFPASDLSFCAELDESAEFLSSELFFSIITEGCFWRTKITTAVNKTIIMKTVPTARTALESNLNF